MRNTRLLCLLTLLTASAGCAHGSAVLCPKLPPAPPSILATPPVDVNSPAGFRNRIYEWLTESVETPMPSP